MTCTGSSLRSKVSIARRENASYSRAIGVRRLALDEVTLERGEQLLSQHIGWVGNWERAALRDDLLSGVGTLHLPEAWVLACSLDANTGKGPRGTYLEPTLDLGDLGLEGCALVVGHGGVWGMEGRWDAGRGKGVQAFLRGIAAILYSFVVPVHGLDSSQGDHSRDM